MQDNAIFIQFTTNATRKRDVPMLKCQQESISQRLTDTVANGDKNFTGIQHGVILDTRVHGPCLQAPARTIFYSLNDWDSMSYTAHEHG